MHIKFRKYLKQIIAFSLGSLLLITISACQPTTTASTSSVSTSSVPMLTVRESTNCRAGPGTDYDIVFTYPAGTTLEIDGRYEAGNFWRVKSDKSPTGNCWMWGEYVDVTGNYSSVSGVTPPALPTSDPSQTLIVNQWEYSCENGTLTFTLTWKDRVTDETGYRIFRNGKQFVELPANSTSYTDTFSVSSGESVDYSLQVYGPGGTVNSSVMKAEC